MSQVGEGGKDRHDGVDMDSFKTYLHLRKTYFLLLMLFLQQYSLPNPGVDLFIVVIHL